MEQRKIKSTANIDVNVTLQLNEEEARALKALTVYGTKEFLDVFYACLGKHYLQPHEKGLESLFETIKTELHPHLKKVDMAKEIWKEPTQYKKI